MNNNIEASVFKQYHLDIPLGSSGIFSTITGIAVFDSGAEGSDPIFEVNFKVKVGFNNVINEPIGNANIYIEQPFSCQWSVLDFKVSWLPDTTQFFCSLTISKKPEGNCTLQSATIPFQIFVHHN